MFAAGKTAAVSGAGPDDKFNYVTMLLHGDGTNGAQNNTFLDSSTNNFTITRNGNTTQGSFSPYGSNWSNYFDGTGDYLSIPDNAALEGFTDFTFECWLYVSDFESGDVVFAKGFGPGFAPYMFYFTTTDLVFYASSTLSGWDIASSQTIVSNIVKNQWYHVAASRSGSSIKLFANGAVTTSITNSLTVGTNASTFNVAGAVDGTRNPQIYISNLRINNTALYTAAFTPSTTPLTAVSGTVLLTCADNRFIDDSTNAFTVSPFGNSSVQRFNPFGTSTAYSTSVIGGSSFFPTSNTGSDTLSIASTSALSFTASDDLTIESWVYLTAQNDYSYICSKGNSSTREYGFTVRASSIQFYWSTTGSSSGDSNISASFTFQLGTWYHVAMSKSGTSVRLFVNGTQQGSTGTFTTIYNGSSPFRVGTFMDFTGISHCLAGYLSNLRLVKGTAVYTSNFTPPTAPVTAITNTSLLTNFTNGAIFDNAMMNDLETVGNAQISTSVVKFGTGSISNVASASLFLTQEQSFGTGDFTWETWIYPTAYGSGSGSAYSCIFADVVGVGSSNVQFNLTTTGTFIYYNGVSSIITTTATLTLNTWSHVALVRSNGTSTIYLNGTSIGSAADSANIYLNSIGGFNPYSATNSFRGYFDEVRITKGYARYTANFTPPTAAFPNIGPT